MTPVVRVDVRESGRVVNCHLFSISASASSWRSVTKMLPLLGHRRLGNHLSIIYSFSLTIVAFKKKIFFIFGELNLLCRVLLVKLERIEI